MSRDSRERKKSNEPSPDMPGLHRRDDAQFQVEADALIREAEDHRMRFMNKYQGRNFIWMTLTIMGVLAGTAAFGWFLLVEGDLVRGLGLLALCSVVMPVLLGRWTRGPLKAYVRDYKISFMPKMARALGGLKFHPERGIPAKMIARTGVIPSHDRYNAEDCFMGLYKGVKIILSEARLYSKAKGSNPVFEGVFAIMELSGEPLQGHTIVTSDSGMADKYANTRWQKLQRVQVETDEKSNNFRVYSDTPAAAITLASDGLLKELSEASQIFSNAPLTAAFFGKKFIFMMIPCKEDMFEASDIFVPVATKQHAMKCKKEIEKILEVIDVFDIQNPA